METLNPKLFEYIDEVPKLKSDIRVRLLEIADAFLKYLESDGITLNVIDVRLVGSNAGYDYTLYSDVDLHLVADLESITCDPVIAQIALNAERSRFNGSFDISIKGIQVEMYVEDVRIGVNSNGIYSVAKDEWVKIPVPEEAVASEVQALVSEKIPLWRTLIDNAIARRNENEIQRLLNRVYMMRKNGLDCAGPKSAGNLIFKELRNMGYLEKLKVARDEVISERLTMECRIAQEALKHGCTNY